MSVPTAIPPFSSLPRPSGRRWRIIGAVAAGALLMGVGAEAWWTEQAYHRGLASLMSGDAPAARAEFDRAVPFWGGGAPVAFRSAQAARRAGDHAAAIHHLLEAERLGWNKADLDVERALIAIKNGVPFPRVETIIRQGLEGDSISARDATIVLADGYVSQFRIVEAEAVTEQWVARWPDDPTGWKLRAEILERLVRRDATRNAYARWASLAPDDRQARLGLVRSLLETQAPMAEVVGHLNRLEASGLVDAEVLRYKARTEVAAGQLDAAAATLDRALVAPKPDARTLTDRAKLERERGRPDVALPFARRAVAADGGDVEALYTLFQCLQQTGPAKEAEAVGLRWRQTTADLARVNELGKLISAAPFDPDSRREMGELFLRNGRESEGLRWLGSALALRPDHGPSHRALAEYFTKVGRPDLAAAHTRPGR